MHFFRVHCEIIFLNRILPNNNYDALLLILPYLLGGYFNSKSVGLTGLFSSPPPQLGHFPCSSFSVQALQKVHSKLQIIASNDSAGKGTAHLSHFSLISNIKLILSQG